MPAPVEQAGEDLRRLGEALDARAEDVRSRTVARATESGREFDAVVLDRIQDIGTSSTVARARWMAGGDPEAGRETGRRAFHTYGQLAAQSAAPLNEVTKRCLRWRDSVADVLRDSASQLGVSQDVLYQALAMVQHTLDVTLVQISHSFGDRAQANR